MTWVRPAKHVYTELLGTGLGGTGATLLLSVEGINAMGGEEVPIRRYMLNVGENTQRLCKEHRIKLRSVEHVFTTSLAPTTVAGLPGVIFGLADVGAPSLTVHGETGMQVRGVLCIIFVCVRLRHGTFISCTAF